MQEYSYDVLDRLISVTEPEGKVTTYTYDAFGNRAIKSEWEAGRTNWTIYTYDENGNLIQEETTRRETQEKTIDREPQEESLALFSYGEFAEDKSLADVDYGQAINAGADSGINAMVGELDDAFGSKKQLSATNRKRQARQRD